MNLEQLKEYLSIVIDMEQHIYTQKRVLEGMEYKKMSLGNPKAIDVPIEPKRGKKRETGDLRLGIMGIIAPIISYPLLAICASSNSWILMLLGFGFGLVCLVGFISVPLGAFLVIFELFMYKQTERENDEKYEKELAKYKQAYQKYELEVQQDNAKVANEMVIKKSLEKDMKLLSEQQYNSQCLLNKIYDENIIFPKYRNLEMVSSLYEYLCSGRCNSLEGADGAYNILEMEIRLDRIILGLDRIIYHLEQIRQNQFMLYETLQESNRLTSQLLESNNKAIDTLKNFKGSTEQLEQRINELKESSAITAYNTERIQKELSYMNRINYLKGRNDGVFMNYPPTMNI